jgi:hypothetical protein
MIVACKLEGRAMSKVRIIAGFDIGEILMLAHLSLPPLKGLRRINSRGHQPAYCWEGEKKCSTSFERSNYLQSFAWPL